MGENEAYMQIVHGVEFYREADMALNEATPPSAATVTRGKESRLSFF
jgi:hypothetical protein